VEACAVRRATKYNNVWMQAVHAMPYNYHNIPQLVAGESHEKNKNLLQQTKKYESTLHKLQNDMCNSKNG
jgi:hypothetical protein